jgi:protein SCO1/2
MPACRRRNQRGLAALLGVTAGLLVLAGGFLWMLGGAGPPASGGLGGPFRLQASDGRVVTERSFPGRTLLIYFGYASCQDVCPVTLSAVADALQTLGGRGDRIQPLFITIDPARDTPAVLKGYVAGFSPRLLGLTGTPDELRQVRREYHIASSIRPGGLLDHTSVLLLVGPDGRLLAPIRADEDGAAMAADIARHLL